MLLFGSMRMCNGVVGVVPSEMGGKRMVMAVEQRGDLVVVKTEVKLIDLLRLQRGVLAEGKRGEEEPGPWL